MKKEDLILTTLIQKILKLLPVELSKQTEGSPSKRSCQSNLLIFFKRVEELLMNSKYVDGVIDQQTIQDISSLSNDLFGINLIAAVSYPEIIDIKDRFSTSHFHVSGGTITEAENICGLNGFNKQLSRNHELRARVDKLFQELTIVSGKALLEQMRLLPKRNNLNDAIESYENQNQIRLLVIKYILLNTLINSEHCHKTMISRSFANSLKVDYDGILDQYMVYRDQQSKLHLA